MTEGYAREFGILPVSIPTVGRVTRIRVNPDLGVPSVEVLAWDEPVEGIETTAMSPRWEMIDDQRVLSALVYQLYGRGQSIETTLIVGVLDGHSTFDPSSIVEWGVVIGKRLFRVSRSYEWRGGSFVLVYAKIDEVCGSMLQRDKRQTTRDLYSEIHRGLRERVGSLNLAELDFIGARERKYPGAVGYHTGQRLP